MTADQAPVLTVLLTTRGRDAFTLRYLAYLEALAVPVAVIIGDGAPDPAIATFLADRPFAAVRYQYRRYDDRELRDFYAKCLDLAEQVETPYAMLMDNDDFLVPSGAMRQVAFLDAHPDVVSSGGRVAAVKIERPGSAAALGGTVWGARQHYEENYARISTAAERAAAAVDVARAHLMHYYRIFRCEALRTILRDIVRLNPRSVLLHELYFSMRAETLGRNVFDRGTAHLVRQIGTSHRAAGIEGAVDWIRHVLTTNTPHELHVLADDIFDALPSASLSRQSFRNQVVEAYAQQTVGRLAPLFAGTFRTESSAANVLLGAQYQLLKRAIAAARKAAQAWRSVRRPSRQRQILTLMGNTTDDGHAAALRYDLKRMVDFIADYEPPAICLTR